MATNIPPHNLNPKLLTLRCYKIDHPGTHLWTDLLEHVKEPRLPNRRYYVRLKTAIRTAYATGRGGVVTRGIAEVVEGNKGRHQIVITEIPYALNKESLVDEDC